jgi:hypothetical protein
VIPEEVDPRFGLVFFPETTEGHVMRVQYDGFPAEDLFVSWRDETGEQAVPMEAVVNEGGLDVFATYEVAEMGRPAQAVTHLDRLWLFWSSTRGAGALASDIFSATLSPRIGPEPDLPTIVPIRSGVASARRMNSMPVAQPRILRRGPLVIRPAPATTTAPRTLRR